MRLSEIAAEKAELREEGEMVLYEPPPGQKTRQEIACGLKDVLSADSCLELAEWFVREEAPWALTVSFLDFVFARFNLIVEDVELAIEGESQWRGKVKAMNGMLMIADSLTRLDPRDLVGVGDATGLNRASGSWRLSQAIIRQVQGILVKRISTPADDGDRMCSEHEATKLRELLLVADRSAKDLFIRRRTFEYGKLVDEQADWKQRVAEIQSWSERVPAGQAGAKTLKVSVAPFRQERGVVASFLDELDRPKKEARPDPVARRPRTIDPSHNSDAGFYHKRLGSVPSPAEGSTVTQSGSSSLAKPRRRDAETPIQQPRSRLSVAASVVDETPARSTSGGDDTVDGQQLLTKTEDADMVALMHEILVATSSPHPSTSAPSPSKASLGPDVARRSSSLSSVASRSTSRVVEEELTMPEPLPPPPPPPPPPPRSTRPHSSPAATGLKDIYGRPIVPKSPKRRGRPTKPKIRLVGSLAPPPPTPVKPEPTEEPLTVKATNDDGTGMDKTTINLLDDEEALPEGFVNGSQEEYIVEAIVARRQNGRKPGYQCLVRWQGYSPEFDTWEPEQGVKFTTAWHRFMRDSLAAKQEPVAAETIPGKRRKSAASSSQQPGSTPRRKRARNA